MDKPARNPSDRPLILVSNDDGIDAPGIVALVCAMQGLGDIHVVAPVDEQSAVGHAITIRSPVRARPWQLVGDPEHAAAFAVTGTPADCVKLAVDKLLPRLPDLVVSGINKGPNTAVNIIYSGTVSAATEAAILGIDSIAFSLCNYRATDYETAGRVARFVAESVLSKGLPDGILLNVNIPDLPYDEISGIEITRQARSMWEESFVERRDPFNERYYWLSGTFVNLDEGPDTDVGAVERGYVSVTPIQHDLTAYDQLGPLGAWKWKTPEPIPNDSGAGS
jgi:5'-nucleotidase